MRSLFNAIRHALSIGDLTAFSNLQREIPMSMRTFKRQKIKRWGKYIPAGPHGNVRGTYVRNPLVAAQINAMHDAWSSRKSKAA